MSKRSPQFYQSFAPNSKYNNYHGTPVLSQPPNYAAAPVYQPQSGYQQIGHPVQTFQAYGAPYQYTQAHSTPIQEIVQSHPAQFAPAVQTHSAPVETHQAAAIPPLQRSDEVLSTPAVEPHAVPAPAVQSELVAPAAQIAPVTAGEVLTSPEGIRSQPIASSDQKVLYFYLSYMHL